MFLTALARGCTECLRDCFALTDKVKKFLDLALNFFICAGHDRFRCEAYFARKRKAKDGKRRERGKINRKTQERRSGLGCSNVIALFFLFPFIAFFAQWCVFFLLSNLHFFFPRLCVFDPCIGIFFFPSCVQSFASLVVFFQITLEGIKFPLAAAFVDIAGAPCHEPLAVETDGRGAHHPG